MCATRVVKVSILDREYAFASQGEQADDHVRRVAKLVDERMREISHRSSRQGPLQVAVLTGLELVDELLRLQREADTVEEKIAERTSRLSDSLGQRLGDLGSSELGSSNLGSSGRESDTGDASPTDTEESHTRRFDSTGLTDGPRLDTQSPSSDRSPPADVQTLDGVSDPDEDEGSSL
ncbi:MAG: cell division protein ZapA [Candidatus Latescibacterota bacterium]|nr:cell division protein ZapA [Candidatus Latescibacterota bacterium]